MRVRVATLVTLLCVAVMAASTYTTLRAIRSRDVCGVIDRNAIELRKIVLEGATRSKRFGTITLGGQRSTYAERLRDARETASRIRGCP